MAGHGPAPCSDPCESCTSNERVRARECLWSVTNQVNRPEEATESMEKGRRNGSKPPPPASGDGVLCRRLQGPLRQNVVDWASGHWPIATLRAEILPHQACKVGDAWAEACHPDLANIFVRAPSFKLPFASAISRLYQNLGVYNRMGHRKKLCVHTAMREHKAISHMRPQWANKFVSPRLPRVVVLGQVYRLGNQALRDWAADMGPTLQALLPGRSARHLSIIQRLKVAVLVATPSDGDVLSLPADVATPPTDLQGNIDSQLVFSLVDKCIRRRKKLRCSVAWAAQQAMVSPVGLQILANVVQEDSKMRYGDGLRTSSGRLAAFGQLEHLVSQALCMDGGRSRSRGTSPVVAAMSSGQQGLGPLGR